MKKLHNINFWRVGYFLSFCLILSILIVYGISVYISHKNSETTLMPMFPPETHQKHSSDFNNIDNILSPVQYHAMHSQSESFNHPLCKTPYVIEETYNLTLYTACDIDSQREGLKRIKSMPKNEGMLFIYSKEQELAFWMQDTYLPLSIAYLDRDFRVVNKSKMIPLDRTPIDSIYPAQYALELNVERLTELGIEEGTILKFKSSTKPINFIPEYRVADEDYETFLFQQYY